MKALVLLATGAIGAVSLLGVTSCSDSNKDLLPADVTRPSNVDPGNSLPVISLPESGVSLPASIPGVSAQCAQIYSVLGAAFSGADEATFSGLPDAFDKLKAQAPEELRDDLDEVSSKYAKLAELYKKYNYDPAKATADPDLIKLFSDQEFLGATQRVSEWLSTQCGLES